MNIEEILAAIEADPSLKQDPTIAQGLAEWDALLEANPLVNYNVPGTSKYHAKQMEFHSILCPPLGIKAAIAGNRCGKTIGCVVDDVIQLIDRDLVPTHLQKFKKWDPPFHVWVGAPKMAKHEDTIVPMFRKWLPKAVLPEGKFGKAYKGQARIIQLTNGSTIGLKTYDQDLDAWASAEVHRIHWDEEPNTLNSAEMRSEARARLLSTGGEEIIGMSPLLGYSWVHDAVWERRDEPNVGVVHMTMQDNPWLTPEMIAEFEEGLTEEEKRMRVKGEFVHVGGLVYPNLSHEHFIDPPKLDHVAQQDIYVGIDPGYNTTAVVFVAFDKESHALVFDELYLHGKEAIPEGAVPHIRKKLESWGVKPRYFLIDPSARNRSLTDAQQVQELYKNAGMPCHPAQNDRETGCFEVKRRLEYKRILISNDCRQLRWEMERYRQDPKPDGSFDVVKEHDHLCDALRYVCMARPTAPSGRPSVNRRPKIYVPGTAPPKVRKPKREVGAVGLLD